LAEPSMAPLQTAAMASGWTVATKARRKPSETRVAEVERCLACHKTRSAESV
jgi:hypothetical protein